MKNPVALRRSFSLDWKFILLAGLAPPVCRQAGAFQSVLLFKTISQ
jgi:hypothetical protein